MQENKVLGALYGAAYGDSLGAVTEFRSRRDILDKFPDGCKDYAESISLITHGIIPGTVTDDFGSSCYFMKTILKHGGAMKVSPVGLLARTDQKLAIRYTKDLCWPTHYNSAAVSGACAIACAVCEAQREDADLDSVFEKAVEGARIARTELEEEGMEAFGPYVDRKIRQAVELGRKVQNPEELYDLLNGVIGTGITVQESIPAVFAIIAACKGDFKNAVWCAVNAGGDTDTIASMTGAILGGYRGIEAIPQEAVERMKKVNAFLELKETIENYMNLILLEGE